MASVKLTQAMRRSIQDALLSDRFDKEEQELKLDITRFADEVYQEVFGNDLPVVKNVPDEWLTIKPYIRVVISGEYTVLHMSRPMPVKTENLTRTVGRFDGNTEIAKKFRALSSRQAKLTSEKDQAQAEIQGVLGSVTTANKLLEEWPEISNYVHKYCSPTSRNLPAVQIHRLNQRLGLIGEAATTQA